MRSIVFTIAMLTISSGVFAAEVGDIVTVARPNPKEIPLQGSVSSCNGNGLSTLFTQESMVTLYSEYHYSACVKTETYQARVTKVGLWSTETEEIPGTSKEAYSLQPRSFREQRIIFKDQDGLFLDQINISSLVSQVCAAKAETTAAQARDIRQTPCGGR